MAGAPQKGDTVTIRIAIPKNVYHYLGVLKVQTTLGASESDVARYLLSQRVEKMIEDKYHLTHRPPAIEELAGGGSSQTDLD